MLTDTGLMLFWVAVAVAAVWTGIALSGWHQRRLVAAGASATDATIDVVVPVAAMWLMPIAVLIGPGAVFAEFVLVIAVRGFLLRTRPTLAVAYRSLRRGRRFLA